MDEHEHEPAGFDDQPDAESSNVGTRPNKRQRTSSMYNRKRAVTACQACRRRKTKCDNIRPVCGFCQKNEGHCEYSSVGTDFSTYDPASLAILDRINYVASLVESLPKGPDIGSIRVETIENHETLGTGPRALETPTPPQPRFLARDATTTGNLGPSVPEEEEELLAPLNIPDFLATSNSCEGVLRWPVLHGIGPEVQSFILESSHVDGPAVPAGRTDFGSNTGSGGGVTEDDFVHLSRRFLAYVHVKNPILDVSDFKRRVRHAAENGPSWDGSSCLVLIACALGYLSAPFSPDFGAGAVVTPESQCSARSVCVDRRAAEAYHLAAKKRLGLLQPSLLYIQCLFLFGVYQMYCLRPVQAWFYFNRACVDFRNIVWSRRYRQTAHESLSRETRQLEQRLFWSCMKSEFELRAEIPFPPSGIAQCEYRDMLPSPPTELTSPSAPQNRSMSDVFWDGSDVEPGEEKSWFYYLAEISFRRMMNTAMAVMSRNGERGWMQNIRETVKQCEDFDKQIDVWHSHIPAQISVKNTEVSNSELAYYVENRALTCREWIHRPFLYYALHYQPNDADADQWYFAQILPRARRCLELCILLLSQVAVHHRHHGTWLATRASATRAILLLAAARSGNISMPEGWEEAAGVARGMLRIWSEEAADLRCVLDVLEGIAMPLGV